MPDMWTGRQDDSHGGHESMLFIVSDERLIRSLAS
jgi:hypothetical protein